jgi:Flp pilus assembly secretin CpaC/tetratricopeptide (TPR) repeat protein
MRALRQSASLLLSALLVCLQLPAQGLTAGPSQAATTRPDPKKAQKAAERGAKAEAAGRLEEALEAYQEAASYAPQDETIVGHAAALRSKLVRVYTEAAERDALAGHLDQATEKLAVALQIDPGAAVVAERLAQLKTMEDEPAARPPATEITGLPRLHPESGKHPINLRGDTKTVYEQLAALFGVKAAFDPDLAARSVHLRLEDTDFYTAMSVLGTETGTFWRPLNATLLFVAQDSLEKRKQFGLEAEQTFPLPAAVGPEDVTEMLRVLRDITGVTHIEMDSRSRTITIRDTPERLAVAGELIRQTERARGEVMLEIELLEVDRDTARKLGIETPSKVQLFTIPPNLISQLNQATNLSALQTLLAGIFGSAAGSATSISSLVPQIIAVGGGKTTFLLTLPGAAADFSDALSLVHSGRQVLLRAQDGKPATFFVGDRFPVTLSLLSGSTATSAFTPNPGGASNPFPSTSYAAGVDPVTLVAADFLNNGLVDLAAVNELDNSVTILLNQSGAEGTFVAATNSPISLGPKLTAAPPSPPAIASAALTSKGFHDLLVTDPINNAVDILFSNGDGTFVTPAKVFPVGIQPSAIVTADFNGDGFQDFAVTNFKDNTLSVFLGGADTNGNPTFTQVTGSPFALPKNVSGPVAMTVADFNADGKVDLAIVNQTTLANPSIAQGNVVVLQGNGDGTFTEFAGSPITVGINPVAIASADLDGNASADLAIVNNTDNSVTILLNNGDGTFVAGPNSPLATSPNPTGIALADFAQNGTAGIAVTCAGSNTFRVFFAITAGLFTIGFEPPAGPSGSVPTSIVAAQLVSGGIPDVAITNNVSGATGDVTVVLSPASLFSGSGLNQQPYPGSEYVDLGVKIKATPSLHPNNEVTLQLEFEIRALSGSNVNGIPIISNRTLSQTVRVKEDEPTLIGGLTDVEETRSITGLPGFAEIPGAGYAFGVRNNSRQDTELLILVTPRRLRRADHLTRTIFAGRGDTPGGRSGIGPGTPPTPILQPTPAPGGQPPPAPGGQPPLAPGGQPPSP